MDKWKAGSRNYIRTLVYTFESVRTDDIGGVITHPGSLPWFWAESSFRCWKKMSRLLHFNIIALICNRFLRSRPGLLGLFWHLGLFVWSQDIQLNTRIPIIRYAETRYKYYINVFRRWEVHTDTFDSLTYPSTYLGQWHQLQLPYRDYFQSISIIRADKVAGRTPFNIGQTFLTKSAHFYLRVAGCTTLLRTLLMNSQNARPLARPPKWFEHVTCFRKCLLECFSTYAAFLRPPD